MSLPKQLITSFEEIKSSPLTSGHITKENVQFFVDTLNKAIPSSSNPIAHTLYRFNRTKYISDKERFVNDIKDFKPYESMILWLDFKDILSFFKLEGKIFLGWDKSINRYRAFILPEEPKEVRILRRGETLRSISANETLPTEPSPTEPDCTSLNIQKEIDDDMDKIYLHMQDRLMAVTKQINAVGQ